MLTEIKRMQKLAGLLKENEEKSWQESDGDFINWDVIQEIYKQAAEEAISSLPQSATEVGPDFPQEFAKIVYYILEGANHWYLQEPDENPSDANSVHANIKELGTDSEYMLDSFVDMVMDDDDYASAQVSEEFLQEFIPKVCELVANKLN